MAKRKYIYVAVMESTHFTWVSTGLTKKECVEGLRERWNKSYRSFGKDKGAALSWEGFTKECGGKTPLEAYGGGLHKLVIGQGYRDYI